MSPRAGIADSSDLEVLLLRPRLTLHEERGSYPLGLVQLLSAFDDPARVSIFDADALSRKGWSFARIKKSLIARAQTRARTLIVGISTNDANLPEALHLSQFLKRIRRDTFVVLGGPGVYFDSQKLLDTFPDLIDVIVRGEGSRVFPRIVAAIASEDKGGLLRRVVHAPRSEDMDILPFPRYEKLPTRDYCNGNEAVGWMPIFAGAGCAHTCRYCSTANFWGHRAQYKSEERLIREIETLVSLGHRRIEFVHDNFFSDMGRVAGLAERLIRSGVNVEWACSGRIDDFSLAVLPSLLESGCRRIFWGMESGSQRALEIMGKGLELAASKKKLFDILRHPEIHSVVSFVYNYPGDTMAMADETLDLATQIRAYFPNNTALSLNNFFNLSGTAFGRGVFKPSRYLLGLIDFDRSMVDKNLARFPFFSTTEDVTGLSTEFRLRWLNYLIDSYPKTLYFLSGGRDCGRLLRELDGRGCPATRLHSLVEQNPDSIGRDLFAYEDAAHVAPWRRRKKFGLLSTRIDVCRYPECIDEKPCHYLFSARNGGVEAYEITEENHGQFHRYLRRKRYNKKVVDGILEVLESPEAR